MVVAISDLRASILMKFQRIMSNRYISNKHESAMFWIDNTRNSSRNGPRNGPRNGLTKDFRIRVAMADFRASITQQVKNIVVFLPFLSFGIQDGSS